MPKDLEYMFILQELSLFNKEDFRKTRLITVQYFRKWLHGSDFQKFDNKRYLSLWGLIFIFLGRDLRHLFEPAAAFKMSRCFHHTYTVYFLFKFQCSYRQCYELIVNVVCGRNITLGFWNDTCE